MRHDSVPHWPGDPFGLAGAPAPLGRAWLRTQRSARAFDGGPRCGPEIPDCAAPLRSAAACKRPAGHVPGMPLAPGRGGLRYAAQHPDRPRPPPLWQTAVGGIGSRKTKPRLSAVRPRPGPPPSVTERGPLSASWSSRQLPYVRACRPLILGHLVNTEGKKPGTLVISRVTLPWI